MDLRSVLQNQVLNNMQNPVGLSQKEQDNSWQNIVSNINKERDRGVTDTLRSMNRRGLLNSSIATEGLGKVSDIYSQNLANAQRDIYNQNQQLLRDNLQNSLGLGMNLFGEQNAMQRHDEQLDWQKENAQQQYEWKKELLNKQLKSERDMYNKQQKAKKRSALLSGLGGIAGSFFGPVGTAVGSKIGGMLG